MSVSRGCVRASRKRSRRRDGGPVRRTDGSCAEPDRAPRWGHRRLTIRYRDLTPLDTDLVFRCWVERDRGMRADMRAECVRADTLDTDAPVRTAEAEAIFVRRR